MKSSQTAFNLIVSEESGDQRYYVQHYQHFDWPQGASGPTIGIGYDCGYVAHEEAANDWLGIVSENTLAQIFLACGLKGEAAHNFVRVYGSSVTITWDQALKEFSDREMPKWEEWVNEALPNTDMLSGDSYGALVSLSYNRGCSFNLPGSRYAEMRSIRQHMIAKRFDQIPGDFLSMRRLWPVGGDLWRRREHEAALFQAGLGSGAPPAIPTPTQCPADHSTKGLQVALNVLLKPNPPLDTDGVFGAKTDEAVRAFQSTNHITVDGIVGRDTWNLIDQQESVHV
jgi:GH24 family phage-related lysozyme (muramidase)